MKKQVTAILIALAVAFLFCLPAFASSGSDWDESYLLIDSEDGYSVSVSPVADNGDLLTDEEEALLLDKLNGIRELRQFDVVVVTASDVDGKDSMEYADDYYDDYGFGYGPDRDGALLLINMEDREWWISTCGFGITALTDDDIDAIGEEMSQDLSDGDFYDAFVTFADECDRYVALAKEETGDADGDKLLIASENGAVRLVDNADLLTDAEESRLLEKLDEVSARQAFDVVIVTASTIGGKSPMAYADDFFDYNGYGQGADRSGALLLISMEDRDWWISTRGYGITALTDFGIQKIGEDMIDNGLSDGDYYDAFATFVKDCDSYVTQAKNGSPVDVNNYRAPFGLAKRILISAVIGLIVAMIVGGSLKGKMTSVKAARAAAEYTRPGSFVLREQNDVFLYNHVSRTAKPQETRSGGGGSSTHTSSSGASHGGGGGKF